MGNAGSSLGEEDLDAEQRQAVLGGSPTMASVAALLKSGAVSNVVVVAGAGLSVSAGIPDFRTPGTGLYSKLDKYGLPAPEAVFDIAFFKENPRPFFELARELHPGAAGLLPTLAHYFLVLLAQKGMLRRMYTQNIDTLERAAGMPAELLVEAHGSFASGTCRRCGAEYDGEWVAAALQQPAEGEVDVIARCTAGGCLGVVKPDITFFGEELPPRFGALHGEDCAAADLLLVLGSSLQVAPVSSLHTAVPPTCPRVLINREPAGLAVQLEEGDGVEGLSMAQLSALLAGGSTAGFRFSAPDNYRDVFLQGDCDAMVLALAREVGWEEELLALQSARNAQLRAAAGGALPPAAHAAPPAAAPAASAPAVAAYSGRLADVAGGPAAAAAATATAPAGSVEREEEVAAATAAAAAAWSASTARGASVLDDALGTLAGQEVPEPVATIPAPAESGGGGAQ